MEITPVQTLVGRLSQMSAALTHYVSADRLRAISASIPKVLILTGDEDHLVSPANSKLLKSAMPEAEYIQWENTGHGIQIQRRERFNALIESVVKEGREKSSKE